MQKSRFLQSKFASKYIPCSNLVIGETVKDPSWVRYTSVVVCSLQSMYLDPQIQTFECAWLLYTQSPQLHTSLMTTYCRTSNLLDAFNFSDMPKKLFSTSNYTRYFLVLIIWTVTWGSWKLRNYRAKQTAGRLHSAYKWNTKLKLYILWYKVLCKFLTSLKHAASC